MSFRAAPLLRASLAPIRKSTLNSTLLSTSRPLTTLSSSTYRSLPTTYNKFGGVRSLNTSQIVNLEASRALADGGVEEAPHSGINVDKATSMDS